MKKALFFLIPTLLLLFTSCGNEGNKNVEFWARGNCGMCKATIEEALYEVKGVATATYDLERHYVVIGYDSVQATEMDFHVAVAGAGYETKKVEAIEAAYIELPQCCKKPKDM